MGIEAARMMVLLNALKLHQGPLRLPTGNFQHVLHLTESLARHEDLDIRVLTDRDSYEAFAARIPSDKLEPTELRGDSVIAADLAVARAVKRLRPEIYHRPSGQLPLWKLPCRMIAGVADLNFIHLAQPPLKKIYKYLSYRWTFQRADRVICVSRYTKDDVLRNMSIDSRKLRVVHHGAIPLQPPDFSLAATFERPFFLVFAHQSHKNAELCFQAAKLLPGHRVTLAIVGANPFVDSVLRPMAVSTKVDARFVGAPSAQQLSGLYLRAVGLLFPSRFEGFGLPVLEAMSAGCPVVCSNVCSLPEVAGDAAIQLAPNDAGGMAAAMEALLSDTDLRQSLIMRGQRRAERFTWKQAAEQTAKIYRELQPGARTAS